MREIVIFVSVRLRKLNSKAHIIHGGRRSCGGGNRDIVASNFEKRVFLCGMRDHSSMLKVIFLRRNSGIERKMVFPCPGPQFENCETTLRAAFLPFPVPLLAEECRRRHVSGSGQEKRSFSSVPHFGFPDGSFSFAAQVPF